MIRCGLLLSVLTCIASLLGLSGLVYLQGDSTPEPLALTVAGSTAIGQIPSVTITPSPIVPTATLTPTSTATAITGPLEPLFPEVVDKCVIDTRLNLNSCLTLPNIRFLTSDDPLAASQWLIQINFNANGVRYYRVAFDIFYDPDITAEGYTVHLGDSEANDANGTTRYTAAHTAEVRVLDGSLDVFLANRDPIPSPVLELDTATLGEPLLTLEVGDGYLGWSSGGTDGQIQSPALFALNGQPETDGSVNYSMFAAFNRTIADETRNGQGVYRVIVRLTRAAGSLPDYSLTVSPVPSATDVIPPTPVSTIAPTVTAVQPPPTVTLIASPTRIPPSVTPLGRPPTSTPRATAVPTEVLYEGILNATVQVYASAAINSDIVATLEVGTAVTVIGQQGIFVRIRAANGTVGWVLRSNVNQVN